jgi:hypothetical protein
MEKEMKPLPEALKARQLISFKQCAQAVGVDERTFLRCLAAHGVPVVQLGPRKRALTLDHFDQLISNLTRPVQSRGLLNNEAA